MDSDGDGITNGEELGDPQCVWTPGNNPNRTTNITHPGNQINTDTEQLSMAHNMKFNLSFSFVSMIPDDPFFTCGQKCIKENFRRTRRKKYFVLKSPLTFCLTIAVIFQLAMSNLVTSDFCRKIKYHCEFLHSHKQTIVFCILTC